jgi:hypothetical protein
VNWLKHAFAIEPPGVAEPNPVQQAVVERICKEVVRRRLVTPALLMLEMSRPLNYVSAQFLHFLQPMVSLSMNAGEYKEFTEFLEQRGSIEYISRRLEALNRPDPGKSSKDHAGD